MKLGLIRAISEEKISMYEPLGLLYIAGYLEKYLDIKDVIVTEHIDTLINEKPDIVGISICTIYLPEAKVIACRVKEELGVPVIAGGPHVSLLPDFLPPQVDIGVIGEGEQTMAELLTLYLKEKEFSSSSMEKIAGITFMNGSQRVVTEPRPFITSLDDVPHPKRELLKGNYLMPNVLTGRGCPYKCAFCSSPAMWHKYRMFSNDYVCKELLSILDITGTRICIVDDLFTVSIPRVKEIGRFITERGIEKEVSFYVNIRANIFNEEMCHLLKEMNVTRVFVGFESGSDRILKFYNKKQTVKDNQRVLDLCHEYGITVLGSFIMGAPMERGEDIEETYNFIYNNAEKIGKFGCDFLNPEPGTEIWEYLKPKMPEIKTDEDLFEVMYFINWSEHLTEEELYEWQKKIDAIETGSRKNLNRAINFSMDLSMAGFQAPLSLRNIG